MTDNAINDRYTLPLLKQIDYRLQNRNPRVSLYDESGNPTINDNSVILHEDSNDEVRSNNQYRGYDNGIVFECNLPVVPSSSNSCIYAGINNNGDGYGCEIRNDDGYEIRFYHDGDYTDYYSYNEGDLFRMYVDTDRVYFSINGDVKEDLNFTNSNDMYLEIGFDYDDENNDVNYTFSNILYYQTGKIAEEGDDGNNRSSLLSGSGRPNIIPTLGNNGDMYNDVLTNRLWTKDGGWYPIINPNVTNGVISLAAGTPSPVDLFNFVNTNYNSILITIAFAQNATTRIPDRLVQVSVNLAENGSNVPLLASFGAFPANIKIDPIYSPSVNPTFIGVRLARDGTIVTAYNYITYKVQIIN